MTQHTFTKDPDAVLDFQIDWSTWIGDDTISSSTWDVPTGITKDSDSYDTATNKTTIWLSSGTIGKSYALRNRIVTTGGRTEDCTVRVEIEQK